MAGENSLRDLLHEATHHVPGVPAHVDRPPGHQGKALQHRTEHHAHERAPRNRTHTNPAARQPHVLVAWQRRIARFFDQEL